MYEKIIGKDGAVCEIIGPDGFHMKWDTSCTKYNIQVLLDQLNYERTRAEDWENLCSKLINKKH
jgi:hypothetical protein